MPLQGATANITAVQPAGLTARQRAGSGARARADFVARPRADVLARLRRITLDRQGLLKRAPFGSGLAGARRAIERLGYVQIDTISVISRAHDHILQVRVPGYTPRVLDRLQADGSVFEYWAHAAAYLPMRDYRFALPRMLDMRQRRDRWIRSRDTSLMAKVLDRVRQDGPLQTRDFEAAAHSSTGWWDWKPAKRALEQLFMQGDLMVAGRSGFQKVYDLPERVLPDRVDTRAPSLSEYAAHLIDRQLAAHGFASVRSCTYQRRTPGLNEAVARALEDAHHQQALVRMEIERPERLIYIDPEALDGRAPPAPSRARLLSPFDNMIILRHRGLSLFGFDYQLECYVPEGKRRFGYFCLPVLYRDRFVGRLDCKAHRKERRLEVKRLFVEHEQWLHRDQDAAFAAIADALAELAAHNDCQAVELQDVQPRRWLQPMARALRAATVARADATAAHQETMP
jgi:hypothetical protein